MIEPISRSKLSDKVYEQLISLIFSGEWSAGDKLPSENKLSEMFNVSRAPIREALFKLQAMGIVSTEQGKGTYIVHANAASLLELIAPYFLQDTKQISDIMEYRRMIEPDCAYKLAKNHTPSVLKRLKKYIIPLDKLPEMDDRFSAYDTGFHSQLVIASGNQFLISINSLVLNSLETYHKYTSISHDNRVCAQEHIDIFRAIEEGRAIDAADLMRAHIDACQMD